MPAAIIPAAIGAAGSVAGGVASGKGAKKAARIQQQAAADQRRFLTDMYNRNAANFSPEITQGGAAVQRISDLLGLSGNSVNVGDIFRNTPGYEFKLGEALRGVNSNAYARGLGNSGATFRALQETAQGVADQGFNNYIDQLSSVANRGSSAKGALAGVDENFTTNLVNSSQNAADNQSNYQLAQAANLNNTLSGILRAGGQVFGSSYSNNGVNNGGGFNGYRFGTLPTYDFGTGSDGGIYYGAFAPGAFG